MLNNDYESENYFLALDGDNIGRKIEFYILSNKIESLQDFSKKYKNSMLWLEKSLADILCGQIIFSGGDSLLAKLPSNSFDLACVQKLCILFESKSDSTLSIGIGKTVAQSYFALKFAKVSGKKCIKFFDEIPSNKLLK